jgi:hypothetical protein
MLKQNSNIAAVALVNQTVTTAAKKSTKQK